MLQRNYQCSFTGFRGWLEFDKRDTVFTDTVARAATIQSGQRSALQFINSLLRYIRCFNDELTNQAFTDRSIVLVKQTHGDDRGLPAIGEQA